MKARRRRERAQGASAQGSNAEGSSVPLRGDRVWVDSWQLQCCGGSLVVGEATSLTVVDADVEHLRPLPGELAATVPYWEEHHADSRWMGQRGGRTLEGRVARSSERPFDSVWPQRSQQPEPRCSVLGRRRFEQCPCQRHRPVGEEPHGHAE